MRYNGAKGGSNDRLELSRIQGETMTRMLRKTFLAAAVLLILCGNSSAENILQINPPGPGVYDQPSAVSNGATVHVAFIGAPTAAGPFTVYYAAINGSIDFTNMSINRNFPGFMVTPAIAVIDNAGITNVPGDNVYFNARHPKIALQTPDRIVIFFQATETVSSTGFSLFRAQINLSANSPVSVRVNRVSGIQAGDVQDVSFGVVASDNTARLAYAIRPDSVTPFEVYFSRIGLDNGTVVRSPIRLSSVPNSNGSRPVPDLRLDTLNRAHVVWSADGLASGTFDNVSAIYYAMIKEFNSTNPALTDNAAIAATRMIQATKRWGHPQVLVASTVLVHVLAGDQPGASRSGGLAFVNLNPEAALQDNNSVYLGSNNLFLLNPPGEAFPASPTFDLYRPEAWLDLGGRIHMTGYGNSNASPVYFAATPLTISPYLNFLIQPTLVGENLGSSFELPNDYTKASFAFIGGKGIVFWSGIDNTGSPGQTLNVTGLPTIAEWINFHEKGCSSTPGSPIGKSDALVDLLIFALPLAFLKYRSMRATGDKTLPRERG